MNQLSTRSNHRRLSRQLAAALDSREANEIIDAAMALLEQRARYGDAVIGHPIMDTCGH